DDDGLVHDQGRAGHAPPDRLRVAILHRIDAPFFLAARAVQTDENARGAVSKHVAPAVDRRRAAWAVAHAGRVVPFAQLTRSPALAARRPVEADDDFLAVALLHR